MKHQWIAIILTIALLLTLTGCSAASTAKALDTAEDKVEAKLEAVEDSIEQAVRQTVDPAPAPAPDPAPQAAPADKSDRIPQEEAEKIALDYAGFSADQVKRMHTEFEFDDGIPQYDVEFHEGDWEYEFEINAENGKILSFDKDHKYD